MVFLFYNEIENENNHSLKKNSEKLKFHNKQKYNIVDEKNEILGKFFNKIS